MFSATATWFRVSDKVAPMYGAKCPADIPSTTYFKRALAAFVAAGKAKDAADVLKVDPETKAVHIHRAFSAALVDAVNVADPATELKLQTTFGTTLVAAPAKAPPSDWLRLSEETISLYGVSHPRSLQASAGFKDLFGELAAKGAVKDVSDVLRTVEGKNGGTFIQPAFSAALISAISSRDAAPDRAFQAAITGAAISILPPEQAHQAVEAKIADQARVDSTDAAILRAAAFVGAGLELPPNDTRRVFATCSKLLKVATEGVIALENTQVQAFRQVATYADSIHPGWVNYSYDFMFADLCGVLMPSEITTSDVYHRAYTKWSKTHLSCAVFNSPVHSYKVRVCRSQVANADCGSQIDLHCHYFMEPMLYATLWQMAHSERRELEKRHAIKPPRHLSRKAKRRERELQKLRLKPMGMELLDYVSRIHAHAEEAKQYDTIDFAYEKSPPLPIDTPAIRKAMEDVEAELMKIAPQAVSQLPSIMETQAQLQKAHNTMEYHQRAADTRLEVDEFNRQAEELTRKSLSAKESRKWRPVELRGKRNRKPEEATEESGQLPPLLRLSDDDDDKTEEDQQQHQKRPKSADNTLEEEEAPTIAQPPAKIVPRFDRAFYDRLIAAHR
jgi:hypothetical protein